VTTRRGLISINLELPDPVHLQLSNQIRGLIENNELAPGARLPTVRQLAQDLGIAPNTVMRAYRTLHEAGCIVGEGGRGTVVVPRRRSSHNSRDEALRATVDSTVELLRHRGFADEQIANVLAASAVRLRGVAPG
jgi:GntR family transcriptional regulator